MTSVMLVYDRRPHIDWFTMFARKRNCNGDFSLDTPAHRTWYDGIRCADNAEVMRRLLHMWNNPIDWGIKILADTVDMMDWVKQKQLAEQEIQAAQAAQEAQESGGEDGLHANDFAALSMGPRRLPQVAMSTSTSISSPEG